MIKVAVVGTGIIGIEHLEAIKVSEKLKLVAVCDINEERVSKVAEEYGVPYFTDYKQIPTNTDAEAVIINLPHGLHCECTLFFLRVGLHVLLEKPMANTLEECDIMIKAAKESRGKLTIGHIQRFFNANKIVKDYISEGKIGRLFAINEIRSINYFSESRPAWFFSKKMAGGGIVMNYGAHTLDKFMYITGEHVENVLSVYDNLLPDNEIEGHAQFLVKMSGGVSATVTFSGYSSVGYETVYIGTRGAVKVSGSTVTVLEDGEWKTLSTERDESYMLRELDEFAKLISGEKNEMPNAEYGKEIIAAIEKIYSEKKAKLYGEESLHVRAYQKN